MSTQVKCPKCSHLFPVEEVLNEEYKLQLQTSMRTYKRGVEEDFAKKTLLLETEKAQLTQFFDQKLITEKNNLKQQLETDIRKNIASDYENKLQLIEQSKKELEVKKIEANELELKFLRKEQALKEKETAIEFEYNKKLIEQQNLQLDKFKKEENERMLQKETQHNFKLKELEKQLDDQKKLAEEMRRKAEQGSMQLQGEVQELELENILREHFPYDRIEEVGKGVKGADCVQIVNNQHGQECGKIIYESKRTKDFGTEWIEKIKKDMRSAKIDVAVIVSQNYPKGMDAFGEKDGVWICSFHEVKAVAYVLRQGIMKLSQASKSQENRGDKMHLLYDYLTSSEFSEQWKAIREGFLSMRMSIQRERDTMERLWKTREKELDKVLLNATHIRGSIDGIAGQDIRMSLNDNDDNLLLP